MRFVATSVVVSLLIAACSDSAPPGPDASEPVDVTRHDAPPDKRAPDVRPDESTDGPIDNGDTDDVRPDESDARGDAPNDGTDAPTDSDAGPIPDVRPDAPPCSDGDAWADHAGCACAPDGLYLCLPNAQLICSKGAWEPIIDGPCMWHDATCSDERPGCRCPVLGRQICAPANGQLLQCDSFGTWVVVSAPGACGDSGQPDVDSGPISDVQPESDAPSACGSPDADPLGCSDAGNDAAND